MRSAFLAAALPLASAFAAVLWQGNLFPVQGTGPAPAPLPGPSAEVAQAPVPHASPNISRGAVPVPGCPGAVMETNLVYPEDIDYGGPVDRAVKDRALLAFDRARDAALKAAGSPEACRALGDRADLTVFGGPYLITGKLASVVFITSGPGEGGLMPYGFLSMNLSRDGVELKASDLFADPSKSLPILWERAFSFFCSGGRSAAPRFYGGGACSGGAGPPPPAFTAGATLEELGHGALRDSGLVFLLGPQDGWNGDEDFSESREELLEMGAVPWLWE